MSKNTVLKLGMTAKEVREHIFKLCEEMDYDPIRALISTVVEGYKVTVDGREVNVPIDPKEAIGIHNTLAAYIAPKIKSIEVSGEVNNTLNVNIIKFSDQEKQLADPVTKAIEAEIMEEEDGEDDNTTA